VQRNFDVINPAKFSLPSKITLVRGNFAEHKEVQGEVFGDGEKQHYNQAILLDNKELHIEIEIIQSKDKSAFYFQPTSYFYKGESPEGDKVEEVVLAFAFLSAGESTLSPQKKFQSFVHFNALTPSRFYNFKSKSGYDTSFQSPWISTPLEEVVPYTLLIEIQEIREGNAFAKLLQTIYLENKNNFKSKFNEKLNSHNSNESKQSNEDNV
jgi:hypothetical protein